MHVGLEVKLKEFQAYAMYGSANINSYPGSVRLGFECRDTGKSRRCNKEILASTDGGKRIFERGLGVCTHQTHEEGMAKQIIQNNRKVCHVRDEPVLHSAEIKANSCSTRNTCQFP